MKLQIKQWKLNLTESDDQRTLHYVHFVIKQYDERSKQMWV